MEFLIILFFFGLSAGVIGKIKGSSFFVWFLIGFCLPFVGTLAALVSRQERAELRRQCENCRAVIPLYSQVCMRCGEDLEFPEEVIAPRARA